MKIRLKDYELKYFLADLETLKFDIEYSDTTGQYRIYNEDVLCGTINSWNNVFCLNVGLSEKFKDFIYKILKNYSNCFEKYEVK